jgi:hypothetical protein
MNHSNSTYAIDAIAGLEGRFGLRIAAMLNQRADSADHDISERLRFAREQAVVRAAATRRAAGTQTAGGNTVIGITGSGAALMGGHPAWWSRLATALPLLVLVAGLVFIDQWHDNAQISAAADVDSALLGDDLPPDAYSDPGFVEFLKAPRE